MSRVTGRIGVTTWALIYGGMALLGIGIAVERQVGGDALGWGLVVVGGAALAIGIVLVWARSRLPDR